MAVAACVKLLAVGQRQHTAATLLQYTLSQSALMAATSLAAMVSAAQLPCVGIQQSSRMCPAWWLGVNELPALMQPDSLVMP